MSIPETEPPLFITVCHSCPMETNRENNKLHQVINHDKQVVFLQGEGGDLYFMFFVFSKIYVFYPPPSPLKKNPFFITIYHMMEIKFLITNFHGGRVINHDKQVGCMEITPFFVMVLHSSKTNKHG
jgi:hypothetical protein